MGALLKLMCLSLIVVGTATQPAFSMNEELLPSTNTDPQAHKLQYQAFSRIHSSTDLDLEENKDSARDSFVTVNDDSSPIHNQSFTIHNDVKPSVATQKKDPYILKTPYLKALCSDYYYFKRIACLVSADESCLCSEAALACIGHGIQLAGMLLLTTYSSYGIAITVLNVEFQTFFTLSELRNRRIHLSCHTLCEDPYYYMMTTVMFIAGMGGTIASWVYAMTQNQDAYGAAFCCAFTRLVLFAGWMTSYCGCHGSADA